jgi:hypothetical protein
MFARWQAQETIPKQRQVKQRGKIGFSQTETLLFQFGTFREAIQYLGWESQGQMNIWLKNSGACGKQCALKASGTNDEAHFIAR